jgi:cell wall assembly regulator SMI1
MSNLTERLDSWLRKNRPSYYKRLLPGVQKSHLLALESSLGFALPRSFHDLYIWKNGQDGSLDSNPFQFNRDFLPLESAKESYDICVECSGDWEPKKHMWSNRWFPFLQRWGGDLLCVDMEGSFTGTVGQVLDFFHDSDDRTIVAPSLDTWLESFVMTLERGMWEENKYGFQPVDRDAISTAFKEMSPGYPVYEHAG